MLKEKTDQARAVIKLADLSRRLETLQEQVLPFAKSETEEEEDMMKKMQRNQNQEEGGDSLSGTSVSSPMPGGSQTVGHKTVASQRHGATAGAAGAGAGGGSVIAALSEVPPPPHQASVVQDDLATAVLPADRLQNFYRRYNKLLLDNLAIGKERERLQTENAQLQDLIQQYVQGTQISDDVLAGDNPLFVVNGRANLNFDPPVRQLRPVVQDAVQITTTNARQHAWG